MLGEIFCTFWETRSGYFWNSGRLNSGPKMTSFLEQPLILDYRCWLVHLWSLLIPKLLERTLLFLFYRWGDLRHKMLSNWLIAVSCAPWSPEVLSSNSALRDSDCIPSPSPTSHRVTKPLRSVLPLFPSVLPSMDRGESGHVWNNQERVPYNLLFLLGSLVLYTFLLDGKMVCVCKMMSPSVYRELIWKEYNG